MADIDQIIKETVKETGGIYKVPAGPQTRPLTEINKTRPLTAPTTERLDKKAESAPLDPQTKESSKI